VNAARGELKESIFFVKGQPIQQGSMKAVGMAGRGLLVDIKANELKKWRPAVAKAALDAGVGYAPKETPIYLDIVFCLLKPASVKRDTPCALIDLDKLCRAVGDSLSDVVYKDDRQNVNWNATKVYVTDPENQGALIRVGIWTPEAANRAPLMNASDHEYVTMEGLLPSHLMP
jgi:Holliday junction resolvase RusA-like endonuclease